MDSYEVRSDVKFEKLRPGDCFLSNLLTTNRATTVYMKIKEVVKLSNNDSQKIQNAIHLYSGETVYFKEADEVEKVKGAFYYSKAGKEER